MPTKTHHRSRSSIDRVFDLLADLDDTQITLLLDDLNHTTPSNVPVSSAIALFESGPNRPKRKFGRASSPVRTLHAELERRHSKRISSAPEPRPRPKTASEPPTGERPTAQNPTRQHFSELQLTTSHLSTQQATVNAPSAPAPLPRGGSSSDDNGGGNDDDNRPSRPSLTLFPPESLTERPKTATEPRRAESQSSRSYKRVSRPLFLSPTATAELHELLRAYLYDTSNNTPASATTSATTTPTTPAAGGGSGGGGGGAFVSPFSFLHHPEAAVPGLDLLEPSPVRSPPHFTLDRAAAPAVIMDPTDAMCGIFEVLSSH
ncbi:hypothetical protein B0T26DRAFT_695578 [Lasiosphaeria miniovina]|uniref:Uncharacterized protein n=1 Tax=Lasiosphaeria miniovina TaxID=1954250 RepID=A0AA40B4X0_9PEZI|nr:uncharacterized protein B0T26DRAFT_695578 [Lasiosphaeria miniovina]KAK0727741.1 hypothetical protein B0T26DRAFT_695578 [Lasiosphaeria miniovina]